MFQIPELQVEGYFTVSGEERMERKESLMTSLSKKLADHEKTVALVCDDKINNQYQTFDNFKKSLKTYTSTTDAESAVETACAAATEHNLTICHLDVADDNTGDNTGDDQEEREQKTVKRVKKFTKQLINHTSLNGMFMVLFSGTKTQNAVAGIVIKKPLVD